MARHVAFLRAINVGGHVVKMDRLKALFEELGFDAVETFIASGNVIFRSSATGSALERTIERRLLDALGYEVRTFVRTDVEVAEIAAYQPFTAREVEAAWSVSVGLLAEPLGASAVRALMALRSEVDDFHVRGRELWWKCLVGQGESKFSNVAFERAVGAAATFRGVNTVRKLATKYPPGPAKGSK
ncbi:MAG: DUF1697 domain-containing protein [Gemmatimonadetes bacterium]|nr:DUF1697 domain-containing protein [Gemmatimonadota bacterium]